MKRKKRITKKMAKKARTAAIKPPEPAPLQKKIERQFFFEKTNRCLYHWRGLGCIHLADETHGQFIGSLTDHIKHLHAPALDIDHPTVVETLPYGGRTRIEFKIPSPGRKEWKALLDVLVESGLMDAALAQEPFISTGSEQHPDHCIVLLLNKPVKLVPSSSPDHFHLYIEHEMPWEMYQRLLHELWETRIIGANFYNMSMRWQVSFLLKPGFSKKDLKLAFEENGQVQFP